MTLDVSEAFYAKLGFMREASHENYLFLSDGKGWNIHLTIAVEGGLIPGRNPFGLYLYSENVNGLAASLGDLVVHGQENKPWRMYEFAFSDPNEKLVRVGWPTSRR
ncbi:MAG: glyoxalase [Methylocella sp.]